MSGRRRCCTMNRKLTIALVLLLSATLISNAQVSQRKNTRFELVKERNYAVMGKNIAGMRSDSTSISHAQLNGGYIPQSWVASACAETIMHLKRFSMFGDFSFSHTSGYNMCGSMLTASWPVDLYEFTPGRKTLQEYGLTGGISIDLSDRFRIGARLDFDASNYAKLKDLRYTNYAMKLNFAPGLQWVGDNFSLGLSALISRRSETIKAEQIGESADTYYVFLDKGQFWGVYQPWTGGGVHLSEEGISGFPMKESSYGCAIEADGDKFFAELSYIYASGVIGEKDATWFLFPSSSVYMTAAYIIASSAEVRHDLSLGLSYRFHTLDESVIEKITQNGVTTRHIIGYNTIGTGSALEVNPCWKMLKKGAYDVSVSLGYSLESLLGSVQYPHLRLRNSHMASFGFEGNFYLLESLLLNTAVGSRKGFVKMEEALSDMSVQASSSPYIQEDLNAKWMHDMLSPRLGLNLGLRYIFKNDIYVEAYGSCELWKSNALGRAGLKLGYTF